MKEIVIQVEGDHKAALLAEMLASLDFVHALVLDDVNGSDQTAESDASFLYQDPRQPLMLEEEEAFIALHRELVTKYLGKYIAIHQGQVVDCDTDEIQHTSSG